MNTNLIFSFYEEQLVSSEAFSDKRCLKGTRACTIYVMYILYMCECVNEHYGARRLCFNPLFWCALHVKSFGISIINKTTYKSKIHEIIQTLAPHSKNY